MIAALVATGLDQEEAAIAARAALGEAGAALSPQSPGFKVEAEPQPSEPPLATEPPTEKPTHPCPKHEAWPVSGTCTRCGTFFCHRCLTDAGLMRPPAEGLCVECSKRTDADASKPEGFGGWLILPMLHLVLSPLVYAGSMIEEIGAALERPVLMGPVAIESLSALAYIAYAVFTATHFFAKRKSAVTLMLGFYAANVVLTLLQIAMVAWVETLLHVDTRSTAGVTAVRALVSAVLWASYFLRSERVARTFVRP
ncbi:MAG: DUF2569 domain-containing protein [Archangium sp.]